MTVVYPGSFDPPTVGHVAVARRASALFEHVVVLVIANPAKASRLTLPERAALMRRCLQDVPNLTIEWGTGLLIDHVRRLNAGAILRGLRGESDYGAERPVADLLLRQCGAETLFMQCDPEVSYVSSSIARELLQLGGDAHRIVPAEILGDVIAAYA